MNKIVVLLILVALLGNCGCNHPGNAYSTGSDKKLNDSVKRQKAIDSQVALGKRAANDNAEPSFDEVLADLQKAYGKVEHIDKQVLDGGDTLQLHETYYCLHDSSLLVPKTYLWGGDKTKDFTANTFATKIILIDNRDTVLNKVFKRVDFNSILRDQLQLYAVIFTPYYAGYDKIRHEFALGYSISIPLTDVGVPAYLTIGKQGDYTVRDEYFKIDAYQKN